jgi:hypothetical protein
MSNPLTHGNVPIPVLRRNYMSFPRELRGAIPELHAGRALELESINGQSSNIPFAGPLVQLKLLVKETGKLTGQFVIGMALQPDAARELAATLTRLADILDKPKPAGS